MADFPQSSTGLRAQVFLAAAASEGGSSAVVALRQLLTEARISLWECPRPWPPHLDAEATVSRATEACDNYLLVLSPQALADACCLQGLLFALSLNKRILPVLVASVPPGHLPEPLQALEVLDLRTISQPLDQSPPGRQLLATLGHQADYHHHHTELLLKALQWERQQRDPELLLAGADLAHYQRWWMVAQARSHHGPLQLQNLYLAESRRLWASRSDVIAQGVDWLKRWLDA